MKIKASSYTLLLSRDEKMAIFEGIGKLIEDKKLSVVFPHRLGRAVDILKALSDTGRVEITPWDAKDLLVPALEAGSADALCTSNMYPTLQRIASGVD